MQTVQPAADTAVPVPLELGLAQFIDDFGDSLLDAVREQCAPVYDGMADTTREKRMDALLRSPFPAQRDVVQSVLRLLVDRGQPAAIINAEMGTGKTMMAIAAAALMHHEGYRRTLVIAPPHLVYKWRREIRETVPGARVWILNGPDTLRKLLVMRSMRAAPSVPEFFVLGRVRMRMGYHWRPAFASRTVVWTDELGARHASRYASCCDCGAYVTRKGEEGDDLPLSLERAPPITPTTLLVVVLIGAISTASATAWRPRVRASPAARVIAIAGRPRSCSPRSSAGSGASSTPSAGTSTTIIPIAPWSRAVIALVWRSPSRRRVASSS